MSFQVNSCAFGLGERIPDLFTAKGANISPAINWSGVPAKAKSMVVICEDPDAPNGTWSHWVLFNWPAQTKGIPQHVFNNRILHNGAKHGSNDFRKIGYGGPNPPPGKTHRYYFRAYALDTVLKLIDGAPKAQVLRAMDGHILEQAEWMGTYSC